MTASAPDLAKLKIDEKAVDVRFRETLSTLQTQTNRFFARLLIGEWVAMVGVAFFVSPLAWEGRVASIHPHVWAAIVLGAAVTAYPAWLGLRRPGQAGTSHVLAVAQMLVSSLLIHLTGGRIETHFHIFGSLALLAFYRDIRVLLLASIVVYADHLLRGAFWPESVYGVYVASPWRSLEHAFWVLFEVTFLAISIKRSRLDIRNVVKRQLIVEAANGEMQTTIAEQTTELSQNEQRFRTLFEEVPVGLYMAASDGRLILANQTMLQILGCASQDELLARKITLQGGEDEPHRRELHAELLLKNEVRSRDTSWRRADGSTVLVRENVRGVRDAEGRVLYFDGSVEDVTDRRKLEERYFQSQKVQAIGQLAGGVAHDFNNLLTVILGYADMASDEPGTGPAVKSHVSEIRRAGEQAAGLTRQLLAFSRKQTLQPRVFSLNDSVAEMDKMLRRLVGEDIEIQTQLSPILGRVKADPGQVQQVILNLAVNARDAMPDGGRLTIETANATIDTAYAALQHELSPGEYAMIAVSDNGTGMPPEVKARLFEPFFTTKGEGRGTGLGLATCHGIVRQSGGHIAVYSEPGVGTTFRVYLPRTAEAPEKGTAPASSAVPRGSDESLLLVEDEPLVRQFAERALSSLGYRVVSASDGEEALRRLDEMGKPSLLVTDVIMPRMGGAPLAERVRERFPNIRILFTSGYTHGALDRLDLVRPGTSFLPKPYSAHDLASKIREMLKDIQP